MFRRRAQPEIVIELLWQARRIAHRHVLRGRSLPCVYPGDLPQFAGLHDFNDATVVVVVVVDVISHLADTPVIERRVRHRSSFRHAIAQRLLYEYVLAGLERHYCRNRMPVVRCHNRNRVQLFHVEQPPEVSETLRLVVLFLLNDSKCAINVGPIHITNSSDPDIGKFEELP